MTLFSRGARHQSGYILILVASLLYLPARSNGQSIILDPPVVIPVGTLSISDIDFLNSTSPKLLFTIDMRTSPEGRTVDAIMELAVYVPAYNPDVQALYIKTRPFTIVSSRTVTNLDLGKSIQLETNRFDADARRWLENIALPSGWVPPGSYNFVVNVTPLGGGTATPPRTFSIVLTNASSIEPVFPLNGDQLTTSFPFFQWRYDGRTRISVFEKLENQGNLEEAASGVPLLTAVSETQSYQYPSAGVRPLQPGRTYVWYVEGLASTAGGTDVGQKSDLRWFTIASEGAAASTSTSTLLEELERALGPKYRALFDQIRAQGLLPQGTVRLNGTMISYADLLQWLNKIRTNPDAVTSVVLE